MEGGMLGKVGSSVPPPSDPERASSIADPSRDDHKLKNPMGAYTKTQTECCWLAHICLLNYLGVFVYFQS